MSALETDHNEKEYQTSVQSVCVFNETQIKNIDLIVIRLVLNYPFWWLMIHKLVETLRTL